MPNSCKLNPKEFHVCVIYFDRVMIRFIEIIFTNTCIQLLCSSAKMSIDCEKSV